LGSSFKFHVEMKTKTVYYEEIFKNILCFGYYINGGLHRAECFCFISSKITIKRPNRERKSDLSAIFSQLDQPVISFRFGSFPERKQSYFREPNYCNWFKIYRLSLSEHIVC